MNPSTVAVSAVCVSSILMKKLLSRLYRSPRCDTSITGSSVLTELCTSSTLARKSKRITAMFEAALPEPAAA